jgi:hypothetical protein
MAAAAAAAAADSGPSALQVLAVEKRENWCGKGVT